jgi:hypothetical protein
MAFRREKHADILLSKPIPWKLACKEAVAMIHKCTFIGVA